MKEINRLKAVLAEQKKTGRWLADSLGKDTATISRWCNNRARPSMETFVRITDLLNIDVRQYPVCRRKTPRLPESGNGQPFAHENIKGRSQPGSTGRNHCAIIESGPGSVSERYDKY